jgi:opacity protein-like surface antigen
MVRITALFIVMLINASAFAVDFTLLGGQQFNGDFEVAVTNSPSASSTTPGEDIELDSGSVVGFALDFNYQGDPEQRVGLFVSHQQTNFDANAGLLDDELDVTHVHITFMRYYPNDKWEPFVLAGIGAALYSPEDSTLSDESQFSAQIAGGANYKLTDNLLLRFDARWLPTFFDSDGAIFCSGGCAIRIDSALFNHFQTNVGLMFRF